MVRKRPAPDMDLPPPRRHVTGDLSDVTAGPPVLSSATAQLPALPTQLLPSSFQVQQPQQQQQVDHIDAAATVAGNTTAFVDGIIRDIIGSSGAGVSVAQLIHNVREIIHPCNPGLASLLELRLRSLLASDPAPPPALLPDATQIGRASCRDRVFAVV